MSWTNFFLKFHINTLIKNIKPRQFSIQVIVIKSSLLLSLGLFSSNLSKTFNTSFLQGLFISENSKVYICSVLLIFIAQMETNPEMCVGTCASCSAGEGFVCLGVLESPLSCSQGHSCNTWHSILTALKCTSLVFYFSRRARENTEYWFSKQWYLSFSE